MTLAQRLASVVEGDGHATSKGEPDVNGLADHEGLLRNPPTCRELALWRDMGEVERLATVWHPDGCMVTTWGQMSGQEFVVRSRKAWEAGVPVLHMLAGSSMDIAGDRAVAQTKMQIIQRGVVHGITVDVTCSGRFCDALERYDGHWTIRLRQPVYELDIMLPVNPGGTLILDQELLASFPVGYRHLACLQSQMGLTVSKSLPGMHGPAVQELKTRVARWLGGEAPACLTALDASASGGLSP